MPRNARHTYVVPCGDKKSCRVQQMLVDPEEYNDWVVEFEIDIAESRKQGELVLKLFRAARRNSRRVPSPVRGNILCRTTIAKGFSSSVMSGILCLCRTPS
jgi:hypothetical protein